MHRLESWGNATPAAQLLQIGNSGFSQLADNPQGYSTILSDFLCEHTNTGMPESCNPKSPPGLLSFYRYFLLF
jgi:hypothetical protein